MASEDFSFDSSYFLSAPPSPSHSVPPSPNAKQNLGPEFSDDLDFHFDISSGGDGFITASSFESPEKKRGLHRCADELFYDGKVKALPPPPSGCRSPAAGAASPRSPLRLRKKNIWNDGFDPFAAAIETVTAENRRGDTRSHRRVRSESPFNHRRREEQQLGVVAPKSPVQEKLREPKGVDFSRRLRQVKSLAGAGDNGRETKRRKMVRFLTMRRKSLEKEEEDRENNNSHGSMNRLLKRLSFNRSGSSSEAEKKKKKKTVAMAAAASTGCKTRNGRSRALTKVVAMQYRPRLLLCLGYGLRRRSTYR